MKRFNGKTYLLFILFLLGAYHIHAGDKPGLKFIENKNQLPKEVNFSARIPGGSLFLQPGRFTYSFIDKQRLEELHERTHTPRNESDGNMQVDEFIKGHTIQVNFLQANVNAVPQPLGKLDTYYNYFIGSDSSDWASKANSYSGVLYADFYKDIDMKVYSQGINLKYDYIVAPHGDPSHIQVQYAGADKLYLDNGNLYINTSLSELIEKRPYAYQFINGKNISVACEYILKDNILSFSFPNGYDSCNTLVIDPLLIFSTYSGSTADNWGSTATPGEHGTLYSAGVTEEFSSSGKFPKTPGAFQTSYGGLYDIAILKYDSLGKQLLYASYLGGSMSESPHSLIVNSDDELILLGTTSSSNFPTTMGVIDRTYNGGDSVSHVVVYDFGSDIIIAKIKKDGSKLLASTYLGGSKNDGLNDRDGGLVRNYGDELRGDIITDSDKNIYISTVTSSSNFPVTKGLDTTFNGNTDAVLLKINSSLTKIIWGTFIGGKKFDTSHTLKLDHNRNIFLAGGTNSTDFPSTTTAYKKTLAGAEDGWIAKVKSTGDSILYSTFTGTTTFDQVYFLDLNKEEEVYVYGQTNGSFPISSGVYSNPGSGQFVQKFNNRLSTSLFSTVFGSGSGIPDISPTAFLVSECNNIYMSGWGGMVNSREGFWPSDTRDMKVSADAFQKTTSGSDFYFIALTDDASQFLYGTYLGGSFSRTHVDGGTSRFDKSGIVYHAVCSGCAAFNGNGTPTSDFPTTPGAWSRTNNSKNCNNAAFKFDLSVLKARLQTNSINFNMPGLNKICIPDKIVFQNKCIGGEKYVWDFGDGTIVPTRDTAFIVHQYKLPGKYIIKLKAIDLNTCVGIDSTKTIVDVYKAQATIQNNDALCLGSSYTLTASGGEIYAWYNEDHSFLSNDAKTIVEPHDTTTYYVTVTEATGCVHQDTVQLNVIPKINLGFELKRTSDCMNRPIISLLNQTDSIKSTDNIFFDFGDGQTSDTPQTTHEYAADGLYHVKLIANREFCTFEKIIDASIFTLKVPNVITPGGSPDLNDKFIIQYGNITGTTPQDYNLNVSLTVYNRWGKQVYEAKEYHNDWAGEGLASGTYYFEVTVEGHATCKDWVHVIK